MQRRAEDLHRRRRHELRRTGRIDVLAERVAERARRALDAGGQGGGQQRRHVEAREDGQAVAQCEECVRRRRHGSWCGGGDTKHPREAAVLVQAEREVGGAGCDEFGGAGSSSRGGRGVQDGGGRVEGVGAQVGSGIEGKDEGEGTGEDVGVRPQKQGTERGEKGVPEGGAAGGIFDDGSMGGGLVVFFVKVIVVDGHGLLCRTRTRVA